jgi:hypothetical protein
MFRSLITVATLNLFVLAVAAACTDVIVSQRESTH